MCFFVGKVFTEEKKKAVTAREVTMDELKEKGKGYLWTSVKGVVIDITENKTFVATVFGALDKTLDMGMGMFSLLLVE